MQQHNRIDIRPTVFTIWVHFARETKQNHFVRDKGVTTILLILNALKISPDLILSTKIETK